MDFGINVPRYFEVNENIATGAQPTTNGVAMLKEKGFDAIVNISPVSTPNFLQNEDKVSSIAGLDYVHFPVDCSNLKDQHYTGVADIMKKFNDKKVFIHCGGNIKSSNLMHMYQVLELGVNEEESHDELLKIQDPEDKWYVYFKKFGMKGK